MCYVSLLDTYTYDTISKKVSHKIIKRDNVQEDHEWEVTEQRVLIEDTSSNLMTTIVASRALDEATKYNMSSMTHQLNEQSMEI